MGTEASALESSVTFRLLAPSANRDTDPCDSDARVTFADTLHMPMSWLR